MIYLRVDKGLRGIIRTYRSDGYSLIRATVSQRHFGDLASVPSVRFQQYSIQIELLHYGY